MAKTQQHADALKILLSPSWLSGFISIIVGLFIASGVILTFSTHTSQFQQQLQSWQHAEKPMHPLDTPGQSVVINSNRPTFKGSWSLIVFWSLIGLVVYAIASSIAKSIAEAEAFRESLDYINAQKDSMLKVAAERIVERLVVLGVWALFSYMFIKLVIPYSITAAHASAAEVLSPQGIVFAFLSFIAIALSLHLHAIFLRLYVGKVRVFGGVY